MNDVAVRKIVRKGIGSKSCPKTLTRQELLDAAVRLNLVSRAQAAIAAAPRAKRQVPWNKMLEAVQPRPDVSDDVRDGWADASDLRTLLEAHAGFVLPPDVGHGTLLQHAVRLNLVSEARLQQATYHGVEELRARLVGAGHAIARALKRPDLVRECIRHRLITAAEATAVKQRPDKATAFAISKRTREFCVQSGFKTIFGGFADAAKVRKTILTVSDAISKLAHQRGFLVWLHLHDCIARSEPMPDMHSDGLETFVRHCFAVGAVGATTRNAAIEATRLRYCDAFPPLPAAAGFGNVLKHAANAYAGAMKRHFSNVDTVVARVKRFARGRLFDAYLRASIAESDVAGGRGRRRCAPLQRDVGAAGPVV